MTAAAVARLSVDTAGGTGSAADARGVRVVLDARPLQEPDRAPLTASYLGALLAAFDADPLEGESFALMLGSDTDDPTERFTHLDVVGRRLLPPTRLLRSGALTVDPFLLSGASLGAAWRADRGGAAGAVYHAAGGSIPLATGLPLVATLLDLAPWELPGAYQRGTAARFGQRLRARLLRDAAAVIVGSRRGGEGRPPPAPDPPRPDPCRPARAAARVPPRRRRDAGRLAGRTARGPSIRAASATGSACPSATSSIPAATTRARTSGRCSARSATSPTPAGPPASPRTSRGRRACSSPAPRRTIARRSPGPPPARASARPCVYAPRLDDGRLAALVRGARAALLPVVSDSAGLPAIEAIACGVPVVASSVGALPEIVGAAGHPRRAARRAAAGVGARDGVPRRPRPRDAGRGGPRAGRRRTHGPGRTSPGRPGPSTRLRPRPAAPPRPCPPEQRLLGRAVPRARIRRRRRAARRDRDLRPGPDDLDERLADGQRHRLAVRVEEQGRRGQALLPPRALDRRPVGRDPGRALADDVGLEAVLRASRRSAARTASA